MALNRKKSRRIHVNGTDYRWMFFENSRWNDITIQIASGQGQKPIVQQDWSHSGTPNISMENPVTPAMVRNLILRAQENNWTPEKRVPALRLNWDMFDMDATGKEESI